MKPAPLTIIESVERRVHLSGAPLSSLPVFNSNPGAGSVLYLDFHGEPAQTWGAQAVPSTPAYDIDGDPSTFSPQEISNLTEIWSRVSEAYSPFDLNVTTVDPGNWDLSGGSSPHNRQFRIVIGGDGSWTGNAEGGVADIGSFSTWNVPNTGYVFPAQLANGDPHYTAVDIVHEAGHGFGLYHQSVYSGVTETVEYNPGNGATAPFMGNALSNARATWWNGPNDQGYDLIQDDMAVLGTTSSGTGYRPLTAGQTAATASTLSLSAGSISGSGIIERTTQSDYYAFSTAAGTDTFNVNVAQYGAMLHARLEIHDANDDVVATAADANTLGQTITTSLAAGNYFLVVKSYGQYGDVGQYTLSGTVATGSSSNNPTISISGAASVNENSGYTLNLSSSDPGHTISSWSINWGDGTVDSVSGNPGSANHTYAAGPNTYSIQATATDDTGTYAAGAPQAVSVLHVPPTLSISGGSSVNEGSTYTLGLSSSDPGHAVGSWTINWGDGSVQSISGNPSSATHVYATGPRSWTISATATDDVGAYAAGNTVGVAVNDVPPTIALTGPQNVNEGSPYALNLGAVTDPGTQTVSSYVVHWGDGSSDTFSTPAAHTHVFGDAGSDGIVVDLVDQNGTHVNAGTTSVVVNEVPLVPTVSGPDTTTTTSLYTLSLAAVEPPTETVGFWVINWGDGSQAQTVPGNPSSVTHTFTTPGSYSVSGWAYNQDGPANTNVKTVTVTAIPDTTAPTALAAAADLTAGGAATYQFTVTYTDDMAVRGSTIGNGNVIVSGPNGFTQPATLVSVDAPGDGPSRTATYQINAPSGAWGFNDSGSYVIAMQPGSVTDTSGNSVAAGALGSFAISVAPPSTDLGHLLPRKRLAAAAWAVPGDEITYAFTLAAPEIVTLSLSNVRDPITLQLFDSDATPLLTRSARAVSKTLTLPAGTYYVQLDVSGKFRTHYAIAAAGRAVPAPRVLKTRVASSVFRA